MHKRRRSGIDSAGALARLKAALRFRQRYAALTRANVLPIAQHLSEQRRSPLQLMVTEAGARLVEELLYRIDEGMAA